VNVIIEREILFSESFANTVGQENFHAGTELMFHLLQQPKLNKQVSHDRPQWHLSRCFYTHFQLAYTIVDDVVLELFPEAASTNDEQSNEEAEGQS
jgi:hypothetical protein